MNGNAAPSRHDPRDVLFNDLFFQKTMFLLNFCQFFFFLNYQFLKRRNLAISDFRHFLQINQPLGHFRLLPRGVSFIFQLPELADNLFFFPPVNLQSPASFFQIGQFLLQFFQPLFGSRVFFFFQRFFFNFKPHYLPAQLVKFPRHAVNVKPKGGSRLVNQINRLVRQKTVAQITGRKFHRGQNCRIGDSNAVMKFVFFFQAAQDRDGVLDARLLDIDRLEPSFKSRVAFNVFLIFFQSRGADGVQFSFRQSGFEHVGRVNRALGRAGSDQSVKFVDEKDEFPGGFFHFF